ncbi:hypothetical protein AK812_SmicGene20765 [Symbiodinium microadriaticum]|uniref:Uncharacterized protein n=1 Tax=Symbiodinium microadriaticum TaxID=2951 RepID=A0A1Q9DP61_SYMMI|nr:hypothetical protein AK812_SmicGene20765 [Symbiodinium microadriaticum]
MGTYSSWLEQIVDPEKWLWVRVYDGGDFLTTRQLAGERSSAGIEELDLDVELFAEADDDDEEDALNFMFSLRRSAQLKVRILDMCTTLVVRIATGARVPSFGSVLLLAFYAYNEYNGALALLLILPLLLLPLFLRLLLLAPPKVQDGGYDFAVAMSGITGVFSASNGASGLASTAPIASARQRRFAQFQLEDDDTSPAKKAQPKRRLPAAKGKSKRPRKGDSCSTEAATPARSTRKGPCVESMDLPKVGLAGGYCNINRKAYSTETAAHRLRLKAGHCSLVGLRLRVDSSESISDTPPVGQPAAKAPSVAPPPHTMPMAQMATTPTPTSSLMPEFNTGQENATKVFCKYGPSDYNAVEMEALAELERSTSSVTVDAALQKIGALDADGFHPRSDIFQSLQYYGV